MNVEMSATGADQQTSSDVDVEQFLARVGLLTSDLVDQVCSEDHILEISCFLENWELVANFLGLTHLQIEEVRFDSKDSDLQLIRLKVLKKWKSHCLEATYRRLIKALLKSRCTRQSVYKVCRLLKPDLGGENLQTSASHQPDMSAMSRLSSSPRSVGVYRSENLQISAGRQPDISPLSLPSSSPLSTGIYISSIPEQVRRFEDRFRELRMSALKEVMAQNIPVAHFRQSLMTLPSAISAENERFIIKKHPIFKKAESIEDIFLHLDFYLSFIDFSLLEYIIKHHGSRSLQEKMEQYSRDMTLFRTETLVVDIIPHLPGRPDPPPRFASLKRKLDLDLNTCTLEDLDRHRKTFASEFSLSKFAIFLVKMIPGSLLEICLIPSDIVPELRACVQQMSRTFLHLEILSLSVDEECLYPFPPPKLQLARDHSASQLVNTQFEMDSEEEISAPPLPKSSQSPSPFPRRKSLISRFQTVTEPAVNIEIVEVSTHQVHERKFINTSKWMLEKEKIPDAQVGQEIALLVKCVNEQNSLLIEILYIRDFNIMTKEIESLSSGDYLVKLTPHKRGRYMLSIKVNGTEITGSPTNMFVKIPPKKFDGYVAKIDLKLPGGLVCTNEVVLVCEIGGDQITMIDGSFEMLRTVAKDLQAPAELAIDSESNIYVSTASDDKIHKLNKNGKLLKTIGSKGERQDQFHFPNGCCIRNGRLYVCDTHNDRIKVYDLELNLVELKESKEEKGIIGKGGDALGEFCKPADLKFSKEGNMYVTDELNNRVQVLSPEGKPIRAFGDRKLKQPVDLHLTDKHVFVTERKAHRVSVFTLDGEFITTFGSGILVGPNGITIDQDGFVFVSSHGKNVYVF